MSKPIASVELMTGLVALFTTDTSGHSTVTLTSSLQLSRLASSASLAALTEDWLRTVPQAVVGTSTTIVTTAVSAPPGPPSAAARSPSWQLTAFPPETVQSPLAAPAAHVAEVMTRSLSRLSLTMTSVATPSPWFSAVIV